MAYSGFVLVRHHGSSLSYSDWAYFEKVEDSFCLKSVLLFIDALF